MRCKCLSQQDNNSEQWNPSLDFFEYTNTNTNSQYSNLNSCMTVLHSSFGQDEQIRREKVTYRIDGGCAALVALFLGKRLYVANAGDCR